MDSLRTTVESNSSVLDNRDHAFEELEVKLADMEDRNRMCNIRVIGLKEGLEGSSATQYLSRSLSEWFPQLADLQIDILRAHRIYSERKNNVTTNRTLIFNVLRYTTRQAILRAARKSPPNYRWSENSLLPGLQQLHSQTPPSLSSNYGFSSHQGS